MVRLDDETLIQVEKPRSYQATDQMNTYHGATRSQVMLSDSMVRKIRRFFYCCVPLDLMESNVISFISESYYNIHFLPMHQIMYCSASRESGPLPVPQRQVGNEGKCKSQLIPNIPTSLPNHGSNYANVPGLYHTQDTSNDTQ